MNHLDEETLSAYIDRRLKRRQRTLVEQHLSACSSCFAALVEIRHISRSSVEFPANLIPTADQRQVRNKMHLLRPALWPVAALAFFAVLVSYVFWRESSAPRRLAEAPAVTKKLAPAPAAEKEMPAKSLDQFKMAGKKERPAQVAVPRSEKPGQASPAPMIDEESKKEMPKSAMLDKGGSVESLRLRESSAAPAASVGALEKKSKKDEAMTEPEWIVFSGAATYADLLNPNRLTEAEQPDQDISILLEIDPAGKVVSITWEQMPQANKHWSSILTELRFNPAKSAKRLLHIFVKGKTT
jgi:anti-sigma factor RsiW